MPLLRLLVIGYTRECQIQKWIPSVVNHLCSSFLGFNIIERFDCNSIGNCMKIAGANDVTLSMTRDRENTCYGVCNIKGGPNKSIYEWTFSIISHNLNGGCIMFGIIESLQNSNRRNRTNRTKKCKLTGDYFNYIGDDIRAKYYGISTEGDLIQHDKYGNDQYLNDRFAFKNIKMIVNTKNNSISFIKNYSKTVSIANVKFDDHTIYHMAVGMYGQGDRIKLVRFEKRNV